MARGRKKSGNAPKVRITLNLDPDTAAIVDQAAAFCGVTRLQWLAITVTDAAYSTMGIPQPPPTSPAVDAARALVGSGSDS